jgi:hypothetical protein
MNLRPFRVTINRRPPFVGLFQNSAAAIEACEPIAFAEAEQLGGYKLCVVALKPASKH